MLKPIYYAWFLGEEVKARLLSVFAPKHDVVYAHHITVAFKPTEEEQTLLNQSLGKTQSFWPDMILSDEKGQAAFVVTQPVPGEAIERNPHVTISCAEGTKPFYSNLLVKRWLDGEIELDWLGVEAYRDAKADGEDMEAWNEVLTFSARFGFFGSDGEVHYELPASCRRCGRGMAEGQALTSDYYHLGREGLAVAMVPVLKCPDCGHSTK